MYSIKMIRTVHNARKLKDRSIIAREIVDFWIYCDFYEFILCVSLINIFSQSPCLCYKMESEVALFVSVPNSQRNERFMENIKHSLLTLSVIVGLVEK